MTGRDYVARVRLSDRDNRTLALAGESCERVPPSSLTWLLASGHIVPRAAAGPAALTTPVRRPGRRRKET